MKKILISFDHGFKDLKLQMPAIRRPALWSINGDESRLYDFYFPRNPSDFFDNAEMISGKMPLSSAQDFVTLPRFGFTGLIRHGGNLYAGSWNGVFVLKEDTYDLIAILSNQLMCDLHGIEVDNEYIYTILTAKDTVVISDHNGNIVDHFTIMSNLRTQKEEGLESIDWRFISKQYRGSTGYWHINDIQRIGDELWLTGRNISAFIVVNLKTKEVNLRTVNHKTPVLLHDGKKYGDQFYFTSVDGKIIIAEESEGSKIITRKDEEYLDNLKLYNRDLVCKVIRLDDENSLGREPNWCRGIAAEDKKIYVTIDGSYGTSLGFGIIGLHETGEIFFEKRFQWPNLNEEKELKYVAGFDVLLL